MNKIRLLLIVFHLCSFPLLRAEERSSPAQLSVNMLTHTEQVYLNGYKITALLDEAVTFNDTFQCTEISTTKPFFGWVDPTDRPNTQQVAYRLLVASDKDILKRDSGDLWDSERVERDRSTHIIYNGKTLEPGKLYYWKVKIWDNHQRESDYSAVSHFKISSTPAPYATDRYPIEKQDEHPVAIKKIDSICSFADFGKAAFGRLRVNHYAEDDSNIVTIHLGEAVKGGRVDRSPGGSIRCSKYRFRPKRGWNTYIVTIAPDKRNRGPQAVLMPDYIGEVTPFRYCEIENYPYPLQEKDLIRESASYPFNESDSYFHSSDTLLNQVWDINKHSIKATSFAGIYIDGDRERIPYEGDALINQLSHYCVAREYNMARYSHEYLIQRPTWPTEWIMQSVLMAWEDYMYTGDKRSLEHYYEDLRAKTLIDLADEEGFISTRTGKVTDELLKAIHLNGQLGDIVDWPHTGILGLEKEEGGETDGFVFTDVNTVVNAYHYRALTLMAQIAGRVGRETDHQFFSRKAERLKRVFNQQLFDKKRGVYTDGKGTDHASLHANMFPLAFGMVEEKNKASVLEFIRSREMACSVYGAQFLLDALYDHHEAEYGLALLTATTERSWYNMIRSGASITTEAWDSKYKPNQDWNHAWGAAPANLIPRKLMGIEPLDPGFRKIRIKPQPATLEHAEIKHPTLLGDVIVRFKNKSSEPFLLEVTLPANSSADIYLPHFSKRQKISMNHQPVAYQRKGAFSVIENVGSGTWTFLVER